LITAGDRSVMSARGAAVGSVGCAVSS
jgi:hypothetical protein